MFLLSRTQEHIHWTRRLFFPRFRLSLEMLLIITTSFMIGLLADPRVQENSLLEDFQALNPGQPLFLLTGFVLLGHTLIRLHSGWAQWTAAQDLWHEIFQLSYELMSATYLTFQTERIPKQIALHVVAAAASCCSSLRLPWWMDSSQSNKVFTKPYNEEFSRTIVNDATLKEYFDANNGAKWFFEGQSGGYSPDDRIMMALEIVRLLVSEAVDTEISLRDRDRLLANVNQLNRCYGGVFRLNAGMTPAWSPRFALIALFIFLPIAFFEDGSIWMVVVLNLALAYLLLCLDHLGEELFTPFGTHRNKLELENYVCSIAKIAEIVSSRVPILRWDIQSAAKPERTRPNNP